MTPFQPRSEAAQLGAQPPEAGCSFRRAAELAPLLVCEHGARASHGVHSVVVSGWPSAACRCHQRVHQRSTASA